MQHLLFSIVEDGSLLSQYFQVASLSHAVGRKYLQFRSAATREHFSSGELQQSSKGSRISLQLVLATLALAGLLTAVRQLFLGFRFRRVRWLPPSPPLPFKWTTFTWTVKQGGLERFREALYSLLSYSGSFSLAAVLVHFSSNQNLLTNLDAFWSEDFAASTSSSTLTTILYSYECAHYLSSLAVVLLFQSFNRWYSLLLSVHHLVALVLLALSYQSPSLLHIGVAVLYLHDLCDILLHLTKVLNQLQGAATDGSSSEGTPPERIIICSAAAAIKLLRMAVFGAFTVTWFAARLYAFPVLVIGSCGRRLMALPVGSWPPGGFLLYGLLQLIALMNVYWAVLIVGIAVRCALRGAGAEAIEDVREEKVRQEKEKSKKVK